MHVNLSEGALAVVKSCHGNRTAGLSYGWINSAIISDFCLNCNVILFVYNTRIWYTPGHFLISGHLCFHHMWTCCDEPPSLSRRCMCHRLQPVNISVQRSSIWRRLPSWVRLTGPLRASAQESLKYLIGFFFPTKLLILMHFKTYCHICSSEIGLQRPRG